MSDTLIPRRDNKPHRAVLWIEAQVHDLTPRGECSGNPAVKIEKFPLYIDGADRFIAERKLNELLEGVRELCRKS